MVRDLRGGAAEGGEQAGEAALLTHHCLPQPRDEPLHRSRHVHRLVHHREVYLVWRDLLSQDDEVLDEEQEPMWDMCVRGESGGERGFGRGRGRAVPSGDLCTSLSHITHAYIHIKRRARERE